MGQVAMRLIVGVCTYQRPQLAETLHSLFALDWPEGVHGSILVADNDEQPTAMHLVQALSASSPVELRYLHAPARNISVARNAILEAASREAAFLAFIDDDEVAPPNWIAALWARMVETEADVVLGPVRGIYGPEAPAWMRKGRFHDTLPTCGRNRTIRTGYTCNVLLRLHRAALAERRFDLQFGCSGGEDTLFFAGANAAGATIVYAPEAVLHEVVPPERARLHWLLRRRYRMGHTHARLLREESSPVPKRACVLALSKAAVCATMALLLVPFAVGRNRLILRGALHMGTFASLVGAPSVRIYGTPASRSDRTDAGGAPPPRRLRNQS